MEAAVLSLLIVATPVWSSTSKVFFLHLFMTVSSSLSLYIYTHTHICNIPKHMGCDVVKSQGRKRQTKWKSSIIAAILFYKK